MHFCHHNMIFLVDINITCKVMGVFGWVYFVACLTVLERNIFLSPSYLNTSKIEAMWILGFCSCVANFDILGYDVTLLECFFLKFWDKVVFSSSRVKMYQRNYSWTLWHGIVFQKNNTTGMFFLPSPCLLTANTLQCFLFVVVPFMEVIYWNFGSHGTFFYF